MIDIDRRQAGPPSLANHRSLREPDLIDALHQDFLGKCYLCECKVERAEFEVDHRIPRNDPAGIGLEYTWTNLFPICKGCNGRREKSWPAGGMASPGEGIEARILQRWTGCLNQEVQFEARDLTDAPALNTVSELRRMHFGGTPAGKPKARDLIDAIKSTLIRMYEAQNVLRDAEEAGDADAIVEARATLRDILSRRSDYTMLIRSKVSPKYRYLFD